MLDLRQLRRLLDHYGDALDVPIAPFELGATRFDFAKHRYLMGVVNLSPDSQNVKTICHTPEEALQRAQMLIEDGAHMIDVGAEGTRQVSERVSPQMQIDRLLPVVELYREHGILTSIDTYYPEVFEACAKAGAGVFNLTGAIDLDAAFEVTARYDAALVMCYLQGETPRDHAQFVKYDDMVPVMLDYFTALLERARQRGVTKCVIDPGLGFKYRHVLDEKGLLDFRLETFVSMFRLQTLGCPTLNILPWAPTVFAGDGREAEPFFSLIAFLGGTHILRTHIVKEAAQVLRFLEAYRGAE